MRLFGLIGKSLDHSFSSSYFKNKFDKESIIDAKYKNFPLENINQFSELILNNKFNGLNVTLPYKTLIIPFLDYISPKAKKIGAVNTILFMEDKKLGFNTDAYGFQNSIKPFLKNTMKRALILGSGGASKAVGYALIKMNIDCLFVSRKPKQNQIDYKSLNNLIFKDYLLIVNTTPLGMYPKDKTYPEIPYQKLTDNHLLVDLVYNPEESLFLKYGKKMKCKTLNGRSMLILQAEKSWDIWNP